MTTVTAKIDIAKAIAAGHDIRGVAHVEIDVASLSEADRKLLAERLEERQGVGLVLVNLAGLREARIDRPTVDGVLDAIRADAARAAEKAAKAAAEEAAKEAQVATMLQRVAAMPDEGLIDNIDPDGKLTYTWIGTWDNDIRDRVSKGAAERLKPLLEERRRRQAEARAIEERRAEEQRAAEERKKEAAADERAKWIGEHGSRRLQRLAAAGIEHEAVYRDERLAFDMPGWEFEPEKMWLDKPRNASEAALDLLDEAKLQHPGADLSFYRLYRPAFGDEVGDSDGEVVGEAGYVASARWNDLSVVTRKRVTL